MSEPGLDLGDIGFMLKGIGGRRGSEPMNSQTVDLDPGLFRVSRHHGVDAVRRDTGACQFAAQR